MRHQKSGRKFSRTSAHRHAMFANMVSSLLIHERIETTKPKAKELRRIADKTISWGISVNDLTAKSRDKLTSAERAAIVHAIRQARSILRNEEAVDKLFHEVAARFRGRPGGYTRILKTRIRRGDATPMAYVELTERAGAEPAPEAEPKAKPAATKAAKATKAEAAPAKAKTEKKPAKAAKTEKTEKTEKTGKKK